MTLDAIKEAISQLTSEQQTDLATWLNKRAWDLWDDEIERDFSPGGRGASLLTKWQREVEEGKTLPMENGFAERRKSRR